MLDCINLELKLRKNYLEESEISSIYFGGGTPSLLKKEDIITLLNTIYTNYTISKKIEITLEANPDDLNEKTLMELKNIGITRLSIGIQSFNDHELKWMNRSHNSKQAINCINIAKKIGFQNISIDLIYGIPNQKLKNWEKNLNIMFDIGIQHFSAYSLTIENKTALKNLVNKKKITPLTEENIITQFDLLTKKAKENSFIHYEISNFGKNGYFSSHNISYWRNNHYLGIGPSAHSFNGESRRWNISSNKKYIKKITQEETYFDIERLNKKQQYNEYILTSLRTIWGVDRKNISARFNSKTLTHFLKEIEKWKQKKYIKEYNGIFTLTKEGQLMADKITGDLFIVN